MPKFDDSDYLEQGVSLTEETAIKLEEILLSMQIALKEQTELLPKFILATLKESLARLEFRHLYLSKQEAKYFIKASRATFLTKWYWNKKHRVTDTDLHCVKMDINRVQEQIKEHVEKQNTSSSTYEQLKEHYDFSLGLWCIDKDPHDVDIEWIRNNAFQLKPIEKLIGHHLKWEDEPVEIK